MAQDGRIKLVSSLSSNARFNDQGTSKRVSIQPVTITDGDGSVDDEGNGSALTQFFTTDGLPHAINPANGYDMKDLDGSVTPLRYYVKPPAGSGLIYVPNLITISILDNGIITRKFGGRNAPLPNGLLLDLRDKDDAITADVLDNDPIKRNGDWGVHTGSPTSVITQGTGIDEITISFFIRQNTNKKLRLVDGGDSGVHNSINIWIRDDITGFHAEGSFKAKIFGYLYNALQQA